MAISVVQHKSIDGGSATSVALAFTSNNAAGNLIWVGSRIGELGRTITVSDSVLNTYVFAVGQDQTADSHRADFQYAKNIGAGANTVTVGISGAAASIRFAIEEVSGLDTSSPLDKTSSNQGSSTSPDSGAVTTTNANEILCGLGTCGNPATFTAGTGYTIEETVASKLATEDDIVSNTVTKSASFSLSVTQNWTCLLATFQAPSSATERYQTRVVNMGRAAFH